MRRAIFATILLLAGCASGPHAWSGRRLCEIERDAESAPDPGTWIALLLRGFDAATGRATTPAVDCMGAQVRWDAPALACADASTARTILPDRPLGPEDVVVSPVDPSHQLVWVVTNRFASGDGLGPAAVVQVKDRRLIVRAIGSLRANLLRTKLRLERIGATEVLVAEGEQCASADPASCSRATRVMPLRGDRFEPLAVTNDGGGCLSPAWFYLGREESESLPSGWRRRYRLDASLAFDATGLTLQEQVAIHDFDPKTPSSPPRPYRYAESEQRIRMEQAQFLSEGTSLWSRMMAARR